MDQTPEQIRREGERLRREAEQLREILWRQARRAFVLELTGTPKSGKTTSVAILQSFFKECGFRVHVLNERAAECPLPMKGHFFFNTWTTCTMIAEVVENFDTEVDILILDRGFFDALIWLELQYRRGQLTDDERRKFADFVLLDRWRTLVDVTAVLSVDSDVAHERENQHLIVKRAGSLMQPKALEEINEALHTVEQVHGGQFTLRRFDTTRESGPLSINMAIVDWVLGYLRRWADPEIAVISKEAVTQIFGQRSAPGKDASRHDIWPRLRSQIRFMKRSEAESQPECVQLVACGVHVDRESKLLILKRSPDDEKAALYGRETLWKGAHVEKTGSFGIERAGGEDVLSVVDEAWPVLLRRLREDLHLQTALVPEFLGFAWDQEQEPRHLGLMFRIPIQSDYIARSMEKKFRRSGRFHTLTGEFRSIAELRAQHINDLEPWSRLLVEHWSS